MRGRCRRSSVATCASACLAIAAAGGLPVIGAQAHSASNAYLTLSGAPEQPVLHGQWDVALRDVEFVLGLDQNGDGRITWGELRVRQTVVANYVYGHIKFSQGGKPCQLKPVAQQVDDHADGAYAALFFDIDCGERTPSALKVEYSLFFDIDPSHRGIFVLRRGDQTATALLAPDKPDISLQLGATTADGKH